MFLKENVRKYFVIVEITVEKYDWIKGEKMKNYVYMTDKDNVVTMIRHLKCRRNAQCRWRRDQSKPGHPCIP